jgi:DNA-binding MarR family transcriptional regulator
MEHSINDEQRGRIALLAATCACHNLRRGARAVTNFYDPPLKEHTGLRITQVVMLVLVYQAGPQTINDMAERLVLDRTTLTRNLKPLEQGGLLTIAPGADQRTRVVSLTAKGEQKLIEALPLWEQAQAAMIEWVGPNQFGGWLAQLSALTAHAQKG